MKTQKEPWRKKTYEKVTLELKLRPLQKANLIILLFRVPFFIATTSIMQFFSFFK